MENLDGLFGREPFLEWIDGDLIRDARAGPTSNSKRRSTLPAPSFNAIHSSEPVAIGDRYFRTCRAHSSELDVRCRKVRDTYIQNSFAKLLVLAQRLVIINLDQQTGGLPRGCEAQGFVPAL